MTEPVNDAPTSEPSPLHLRDRLLAVLTEYETKEAPQAVEAVCSQLSNWMNLLADSWIAPGEFDVDMGIRRASAELLKGLAHGIDAAAPVSPQDPGVQ